jgi:hypothetical protein
MTHDTSNAVCNVVVPPALLPHMQKQHNAAEDLGVGGGGVAEVRGAHRRWCGGGGGGVGGVTHR